jgi:general secretion pathway protein G
LNETVVKAAVATRQYGFGGFQRPIQTSSPDPEKKPAERAAFALPSYMHSIEHGKEQVRAQNLAVMRDAIDKFYGDNGAYPDTLEDVVTRHYLRAIPVDPVNGDDKWAIVASPDDTKHGVYDIVPASSPQGKEPDAGGTGK